MDTELSQRDAARKRETARALSFSGCARDVLWALRETPLAATELAVVLRGSYRPRTIYGAILTLRRLGVVRTTRRRTSRRLGHAEIWRCA